MSLPIINLNISSISASDSDDYSGTSIFPSLTLKERIMGFVICWVMGLLISLSSFGAFTDLVLGEPFRFAILYSLGNLTSVASTMFLVGPMQQLKNMMHRKRRLSAGLYIGGLSFTLLTVLVAPDLTWLVIILVILQWAALLWYSLSYIPFGHRVATGIASRLIV